jgi:hypothetical protein
MKRPGKCRDETLFEAPPCAGHRRETIPIKLSCCAYFLAFEVLVAFMTLAAAAFLAVRLRGALRVAFFATRLAVAFFAPTRLAAFLAVLRTVRFFAVAFLATGRFLAAVLRTTRFLGGFLSRFPSSFLGSGHSSSQLLISWQWLPSKSVQERLNQQIAVRGVP